MQDNLLPSHTFVIKKMYSKRNGDRKAERGSQTEITKSCYTVVMYLQFHRELNFF